MHLRLLTLVKIFIINHLEFLPRARTVHVLTVNLLFGFWLLLQSLMKAYSINICVSEFQTEIQKVDHQYTSNILPVNLMFILMMLPILYSSFSSRSTISYQAFLLVWTISIFSLVTSICISKAYNSIWTLLLYVPSSLVVLYQNDYQRREISNLIISKDHELVTIKAETKAIVKEQQNMVSNVTHDLKTVSRNY